MPDERTQAGMDTLLRSVSLARCMFRDAQEEPCGSAASALAELRLGHGFIARGAINSGLAALDRADAHLLNVHYYTPENNA